MAQFDLPLSELETYSPEIEAPADFDEFWRATLAEAKRESADLDFRLCTDAGLSAVDTYDVSFPGFGGQAVRGWLMIPKNVPEPSPCVIQYVGYGGGRSLPVAHTWAAAAGIGIFVMDARGQGAGWSPGDTPDDYSAGGPQVPGCLTRGVADPTHYYYRRLITDAVFAVSAVSHHPRINAQRLAVAGASQGGLLSMAAAALSEVPLRVMLADVPFLCHPRRAVQISDQLPYAEIVKYLSCHRSREADVFRTLSYVDGCNFAKRIKVDSYLSVGLMDQICPPSTVFAAYNRIDGVKKDLKVWPYNGHEGGDVFALDRWVKLLRAYLTC